MTPDLLAAVEGFLYSSFLLHFQIEYSYYFQQEPRQSFQPQLFFQHLLVYFPKFGNHYSKYPDKPFVWLQKRSYFHSILHQALFLYEVQTFPLYKDQCSLIVIPIHAFGEPPDGIESHCLFSHLDSTQLQYVLCLLEYR